MKLLKPVVSSLLAATLAVPQMGFAASHREAPITSLDQKADITDVYAFVSYDDPTKATLIMNVDPFLEPSNGPNYFPFDDNVLYAIHVDNNNDASDHVVFQVRFSNRDPGTGSIYWLCRRGRGDQCPGECSSSDGTGNTDCAPCDYCLGRRGISWFELAAALYRNDDQGRREHGADEYDGKSTIRGPDERGPANDAELSGAGCPGNLRLGERNSRVCGNGGTILFILTWARRSIL